MARLDQAKAVAGYWETVARDALRHAWLKKPRELVIEFALIGATIFVLETLVAPGESGGQVRDELRWAIASIGAFIGSGFVLFVLQLIAAPLRLQKDAIEAGIREDRGRRVGAQQQRFGELLTRGSELRERVKGMLDDSPNVDDVARDIRGWQDEAIRSVKDVLPEMADQFRAAAGLFQLVFDNQKQDWPPTWRAEMDDLLGSWISALQKYTP